jgi:hypothetical protein
MQILDSHVAFPQNPVHPNDTTRDAIVSVIDKVEHMLKPTHRWKKWRHQISSAADWREGV